MHPCVLKCCQWLSCISLNVTLWWYLFDICKEKWIRTGALISGTVGLPERTKSFLHIPGGMILWWSPWNDFVMVFLWDSHSWFLVIILVHNYDISHKFQIHLRVIAWSRRSCQCTHNLSSHSKSKHWNLAYSFHQQSLFSTSCPLRVYAF